MHCWQLQLPTLQAVLVLCHYIGVGAKVQGMLGADANGGA